MAGNVKVIWPSQNKSCSPPVTRLAFKEAGKFWISMCQIVGKEFVCADSVDWFFMQYISPHFSNQICLRTEDPLYELKWKQIGLVRIWAKIRNWPNSNVNISLKNPVWKILLWVSSLYIISIFHAFITYLSGPWLWLVLGLRLWFRKRSN